MQPSFRLPPRLNQLVWTGLAVYTDSSITLSAIYCLVALRPAGGGPPIFAVAAAELIRVLLSGWLFFTYFFRPGSRSWIPPASIRERPGETARVVRAFSLVGGTNLILRLAALRLAGSDPFPDFFVWAVSFTTLVVGADELLRWWRSKRARASTEIGLGDFGLVHKAEKKIKSKLTPEEQSELAKLVYEARELERTDVVRLVAGVLWGGLLVNFILTLLQEIFGRRL